MALRLCALCEKRFLNKAVINLVFYSVPEEV